MMTKAVRSRVRFLPLLSTLAALMLLAVSATAIGAPSSGTMSLTELQAKLNATGGAPLEGYMKTVMQGATITRIPVRVTAVTYGAYPGTSLIMFEATGPEIDRVGGIASGMSGSPLYVEGRMIGALSYGDWFTLRGTGLATPIEYMTPLESAASASHLSLPRPVLGESGVVQDLIVTDKPERYQALSAAGTLVMSPLAAVRLSGPAAGTKAFDRLKAAYEKAGISVQSGQGALAGEAVLNGQLFSAPFEDGSAIAVLEARGDVWAGGIGTVTYVDGGKVLAFGHPYANMGDTDWYMLNAWIDGVWPSSMSAYKYGRPGAVRGSIVRDKWSGIMGTTGQSPAETPITGVARSVDTGRVSSATSYITRYALDQPWGPDLASYALNMASYRLNDLVNSFAGSADSTTTIVVSDGKNVHTVKTHDVFDSQDVGWETSYEAYNILQKLSGIKAYGLEEPRILSVDQETVYSKRRRSATVVDVQTPDGLVEGDNRVVVSLLVYGVAETQTVETTLTIPEGTPLTGQVSSGLTYEPGQVYYLGDGSYMSFGEGTTERKSIAELVESINNAPANNLLTVKYAPMSESEKEISAPATTISATATTDWVIGGYVTKSTSTLDGRVSPEATRYGGYVSVNGSVQGPMTATVEIYGTAAGDSTETLLATAKQKMSEESFGFEAEVGPLRKNTSLRIVYPGNKSYLSSVMKVDVRVSAGIRLSASSRSVKAGSRVTLDANVRPADTAGDKVALQRWSASSRSWKTVAKKSLVRSGSMAKATFTYRPNSTVRLRARYLGGETNTAASSASLVLRVR